MHTSEGSGGTGVDKKGSPFVKTGSSTEDNTEKYKTST